MDANRIDRVKELLAAILLRLEFQVPSLASDHTQPIYPIGSHEPRRPDRLGQAHETTENFYEGYSMAPRERTQRCGGDLDGAALGVRSNHFQ